MIVPRSDVIERIEARLAGRLSDAALAGWAFDLFYEIDQGQREVAEGDAEAIGLALDELMFADEESFALDEADLRRLLDRLQQP